MRAAARVLFVLSVASACAEDREPPPQDDGGTSTGGSSGTSTGPTTPDLGAAESTGPGYPLPNEDALLQCVLTCEVPADCCPPNTAGLCPSAEFPYDFACIEGLCVAPPCTSDAECGSAGEVCVPVRGTPRCVVPCDGDDSPCTAIDASMTCSGTADDQRSYCFAHCENPGVFCGNQTCDAASGECVCTSAGQCQVDWDCV